MFPVSLRECLNTEMGLAEAREMAHTTFSGMAGNRWIGEMAANDGGVDGGPFVANDGVDDDGRRRVSAVE